MKHLGDITQIRGSEIEPVDCITGGSPCQDLSQAGKRKGLAGERSGLFMEQIRIIKEMRENDRSIGRAGVMVRPRYMVWENVPGAFSSNKGEDFATVLEETIRIAEPEAPDVPVPEKGWPTAGILHDEMGTWSVAWRVHDAQFWGVPQRRKRIALVADFGGLSAPEVLFERKGLRRDIDESETPGEETAGGIGESLTGTSWCIKGNAIDRDTAQNGKWANEDVSYSLDATDRHGVAIPVNTQIATRHKALGERTGLGIGADGDPAFTLQAGHEHGVAVLNDQGGAMMSVTHEVTGTLRSQEHGHQPVVAAGFKAGQAKAGGIGWQEECAATLSAGASGVEPTVFDARGNGNGHTVPTLTGDHQNRVTDYTAVVTFAEQSHGSYKKSDVGSNQNARQGKSATDLICYGLDCRNGRESAELSGTLQAKESGGYSYNCTHPVRQAMTVRRLTPLECERLQGYPDGWTDIGEWTDSKGKKRQTTDTNRYKALGNSIALPFWFWLLRRISAQYERSATLGSLFDGIGGFPLCWERCNGKGTAIWASEIEEFPIAVTKRRFGDD